MQRVTILINRKKYISVSDRGGGGKNGIATGGWVVSEKPLGRVSITQIRSFCTLIDFRCRVSSDFSDLFTKLYFHSSKLVDEYVGSKIQTSLATKITRDACKNCTRLCSFFFFLFQRSEHFNRKIYSIGWNGPLPQRKKAFSSFSSFYNRHHRDRKWPISARVELVKLCLTYTPAIS